jgi:hypothetical protein
MKRIFLFLSFALLPAMAWATIDVMPKVVGSADTDSVIVTWGTIDTTYYSSVANADSLVILIYPPDNAAPESTADGGTGVLNPTTGYYEYHRRGANATPDLGIYRVCVKAWKGAGLRGIGTVSYYVTSAGTYYYALHDSTRDLAKDSLANAITATNKANFKATGFATSTQGDSVTQAISDANKINFHSTGDTIQRNASILVSSDNIGVDLDNVSGTLSDAEVEDDVKVHIVDTDTVGYVNWFTVGAAAFFGASVCQTNISAYDGTGYLGTYIKSLYDSQDWNQWDNADSDTGSGMGQWFADWFNANYWLTATGFATHSAADVKALWGDTLAYLIAFRDSVNNAITATNKANFRATGFATSTQGDSVTQAISDANKVNFMVTLPDSYTIDKSSAWNLGVEVTDKTGFKLAEDGLDTDSSFTNAQTVLAEIKSQTDKLTFNAQDSLIVDYSNIPMISLPDSYTIDKSNAWGLGVDIVGPDAESLLVIRNYAHAVQESINAHAPHGDDWGQSGVGLSSAEHDTLFEIRNYSHATQESINAHAPHGNNWGGIADVSGLSTFDVSSDKVTLVDSSAADISYIANNPDDFKDGVGGTGSYKDTIIVLDGDTNTIEGVSITVRNASGTVVATDINGTDVNGIEIFNLDAATYNFALQRIGVIITHDTSITVSGNQTDTIWVTAYSPSSPPSGSVTRIEGWTRTYGFQKTDKVTISFSTHDPNLIDTTSGVFIDKITEVTYADTGYFYIDLIPSLNLLSKSRGIEIDSVCYDVSMSAPGRRVFNWGNIFIPRSEATLKLYNLLK